MSDELVKRLREDQPVTQDMGSTMQCALQDAAADRIEALEVNLAKAIGDLGRLSRAEVFGDGGAWGMRLSEDALGREILARMKFARTTLAELTGDKNE